MEPPSYSTFTDTETVRSLYLDGAAMNGTGRGFRFGTLLGSGRDGYEHFGTPKGFY